MRNAVPMQWIEQAEARQVLTAARFELAPPQPWCGAAGASAAQWLARARSWIAPGCPMGLPLVQALPALTHSPAGRERSVVASMIEASVIEAGAATPARPARCR